jgi:flagellar hook-basal body complex protein FliE
MIDPVTALGAPLGSIGSMESATAAQPPTADFATWLTQQVDDVNNKIAQADMQVRELAVGTNTNIHQVMISLEKAHLSLELVMQVRNKVLEAYQNMMQMQV